MNLTIEMKLDGCQTFSEEIAAFDYMVLVLEHISCVVTEVAELTLRFGNLRGHSESYHNFPWLRLRDACLRFPVLRSFGMAVYRQCSLDWECRWTRCVKHEMWDIVGGIMRFAAIQAFRTCQHCSY